MARVAEGPPISDQATTSPDRPERALHPCAAPFVLWATYATLAVIVAVLAASPVWLLLAVPSLGWMFLLGAKLAAGHPTVGVQETGRLDQMLIDVGGVDAFGVCAQDQCDSPVVLRHGKQPLVFAAVDFVQAASDEVLRGVAALQHAALDDPARQRRLKQMRIIRPAVAFALTVPVAVILFGNGYAVFFAVFATGGVSLWVVQIAYSAQSWSSRELPNHHAIDRVAARAAGTPDAVADALQAMDAWRRAHRQRRSLPARIAYLIITPITPSWHERERAAALRRATAES
jgi:hypothetical protein